MDTHTLLEDISSSWFVEGADFLLANVTFTQPLALSQSHSLRVVLSDGSLLTKLRESIPDVLSIGLVADNTTGTSERSLCPLHSKLQ